MVLTTGDGALQTAELGMLLGQGLTPVVIVLNDSGYAVERVIRNPTAGYHDIPHWD